MRKGATIPHGWSVRLPGLDVFSFGCYEVSRYPFQDDVGQAGNGMAREYLLR